MDVYLLTRKILKDATIGMHGHFAFYAEICHNDSKWLSWKYRNTDVLYYSLS